MNKNEKTIKSATDGEMSANKKKKGGKRFNIIDLLLILIAVALVATLVIYLLPGITDRISANGETKITYVLEFRGVDDSFIANVQNGDRVYNANQNFNMGVVKSVATDSYSSLVYDQTSGGAVMKDHPNLKTLIVTVNASAIYTDGEGYSINGERIAVGCKYDIRFPNFTGSAYCTQIKISAK